MEEGAVGHETAQFGGRVSPAQRYAEKSISTVAVIKAEKKKKDREASKDKQIQKSLESGAESQSDNETYQSR